MLDPSPHTSDWPPLSFVRTTANCWHRSYFPIVNLRIYTALAILSMLTHCARPIASDHTIVQQGNPILPVSFNALSCNFLCCAKASLLTLQLWPIFITRSPSPKLPHWSFFFFPVVYDSKTRFLLNNEFHSLKFSTFFTRTERVPDKRTCLRSTSKWKLADSPTAQTMGCGSSHNGINRGRNYYWEEREEDMNTCPRSPPPPPEFWTFRYHFSFSNLKCVLGRTRDMCLTSRVKQSQFVG